MQTQDNSSDMSNLLLSHRLQFLNTNFSAFRQNRDEHEYFTCIIPLFTQRTL